MIEDNEYRGNEFQVEEGRDEDECHAGGVTREAYKVEEVAKLLGCHPKTVRKLCKEGRIQSVKLGPRCARITRQAIEAFLTGQSLAG